jgi:hypothetical protein
MEATVVFAVVLLGAGTAYRLIQDLLAPAGARYSSPTALASSQSGSPGLSTGQQMRRWLLSLLLASLAVGELAILALLCVVTLDSHAQVRVPHILVTALRFFPVSGVASLLLYFVCTELIYFV